jgi:hypothetical protein
MISAICVSHSSRWGLLQRAILNFQEQTVGDKELVIVVNQEEYDAKIREFLGRSELHGLKIRTVCTDFVKPGEAFRRALDVARGQFLACWDDDDQSHPRRLEIQREMIGSRPAIVLRCALYYLYEDNALFFANLYREGRPSWGCAASSLLLSADAAGAVDVWRHGSWAANAVDKLNKCVLLDQAHKLFVVGSNGDNCRRGHRRALRRSRVWTSEQIIAQTETVVAVALNYKWNAGRVIVCGLDTPAIEIDELPAWPAELDPVLPEGDWRQRLPTCRLQRRLVAEYQQR